jgi:hypothetical protein
MENFTGTIIEESLEDNEVLKKLKITSTEVEKVTKRHRTPWLDKWTLHKVEIPADNADKIAEEIRGSLDSEHDWYADYKNDKTHYIIFRNKIFVIDRKNSKQYLEAKKHGLSLGIPEYQVDFAPDLLTSQSEK